MSTTFDEAREALRLRQADSAFEHGLRVAQTAGSLAMIYGVPHEDAMLAGLLHDWDRELAGDDLVARAQELGLELDDADMRAPKLIHAWTGSEALSIEFPHLSQDVLVAVRSHTLGGNAMPPLAQVVYIADMIEPARHFKGVDDLREAVGSLSLDELFALAYQHTVLHLVRARKPLHPSTAAVYNAVVARTHDEF